MAFKVIVDEFENYSITGSVKIPKAYIKKLKSLVTGEYVYFIDIEYGMKHKLDYWMKFSVKYPKNKKWCELALPYPITII